ncbi:hypothetical protein OG21DRAFT_1543657 [Imleria badia]|nr:hypothetical protein OG21DRAFT_1543657 [Imleria badia]
MNELDACLRDLQSFVEEKHQNGQINLPAVALPTILSRDGPCKNVPHHPEVTHSDPVGLATSPFMKLKTRGDMNTIRCLVLSHSANAIPIAHIRYHLFPECSYLIHEDINTSRVAERPRKFCKSNLAAKQRSWGDIAICVRSIFSQFAQEGSSGHAFRPCRPHLSVSDDTTDSITDLGVT